MTGDQPRPATTTPPVGSLEALRERHGTHIADMLERQPAWARDFTDLSQEWRRLVAEVFGTFLLVLVGAGAAVLEAKTSAIGRVASVTAPGLLVMAVILSLGAVSGAHLNPVVSVAFALRRDFHWRRVPGYVAAQTVGAVLACAVLRATFGSVGDVGATLPKPGFSSGQAFVIETVLTLGLVSVILGTASAAQNVGPLAALGVGGYIVAAGLWASPGQRRVDEPGAVPRPRHRASRPTRALALPRRAPSRFPARSGTGLRSARTGRGPRGPHSRPRPMNSTACATDTGSGPLRRWDRVVR